MGKSEYPVFEEWIPVTEGEHAFGGAEFVNNPEPRCPCVLLVDTSASMAGAPIAALNEGLKRFREALREDDDASKRVEIAIVAFGPTRIENGFATPEYLEPPELVAEGETPLAEAIEEALALVYERKETYRANGINYYRPWIFLITASAPAGPLEASAKRVRSGEREGRFAFFQVGVQNADVGLLARLSTREPLRLDGLRFGELFTWLARALQRVARSPLGTEVALPSPAHWRSA